MRRRERERERGEREREGKGELWGLGVKGGLRAVLVCPDPLYPTPT